MPANYNNSAWFYDRLSKLVYGKALVNAQVWLLGSVPANSNILIAGGGTGWILEELTKIHPTGLNITYVEVAKAMLSKSKTRYTGNNKVVYIHDAVENVRLASAADVVITPFLFDNFKEGTLIKVFNSINEVLKPGGLWLNTDFQLTGKWWQRLLLKSMFVFFKLICNIEASELPKIENQFQLKGYTKSFNKSFYGNFISSNVYRKNYQL